MLDEHLERLERGADAISLELPYTIEIVKEIIFEGVAHSVEHCADVYFQVTRGIYPRLHVFLTLQLFFP
ncbi:aminotransferase class IV [Bacillus sp. DJP31]|uniref:aminotransferase class IV n=1 Tax=Bacillus sp. DJP31 TaxID=3409789 RepID=UPI003BB543C4